jgi:hypothetical protein
MTVSMNAQTITVVDSGLMGPVGICRDDFGNLFVAEAGSGNNDGRISMIDQSGNSFVVVDGLPSFFDTATNEITGPWRPYITADSMLWVIVGKGPDTSAGSIMQFDLTGWPIGSTVLTVADTTKFIDVQTWALNNGFTDSNVYSAEWDSDGNIYAADAGANAVIKIDTSGMMSVLVTFAPIPNPFPGPPMIDFVPTKIISNMNGGFYICNLTGFPFLQGLSEIALLDTTGNVTTQVVGLSQAVDLQIDPMLNLYALQFGMFDTTTFMFAPNSASIVRILTSGDVDTLATGFGPSAGMCRDTADGFYVTELMTGRVLHIANTTTSVKDVTPKNVSNISAYPNPSSDNVTVSYRLEKSTDVNVSLTDQAGSIVYSKDFGKKESGNHTFELKDNSFDIKNISSGIYYLTINSNNSKQTISIIRK